MPNTTHTLYFEGPFSLCGNQEKIVFQDVLSKQPGLYLWTVPYVRGGLIITYIGETRISFGNRLKEHMIQTVGELPDLRP
jgi:hypothetical protein